MAVIAEIPDRPSTIPDSFDFDIRSFVAAASIDKLSGSKKNSCSTFPGCGGLC